MLVGYARVSTQDQNPALQTDALKAADCHRVFIEKASGAQRDRPELKAALDYRLARTLAQLVETVEGLSAQGVGLRSLTEDINTATAGGRLVFHVFGALAEFERSVIRERTCAGLDAAKARGRRGGRPSALGAKDLAAAKALLADPEITVEDVAKRLNIAPSTLYRHLPGGRSGLAKALGR